GVMFVNITEDEKGQPFEVFITLGKAGGSAMAGAEAISRLLSLALRSGIPMMEIHPQFRGISSERPVGLGPDKVLSGPHAIGNAVAERHRDRVVGVQQGLMPTADQGGAPDLTTSMTHQVPASLRPMGSSAAEMELQLGLHHSAQAFIGTCPDCGSQMEYAE